MITKISNYLRSSKFKNRMYRTAIYSLMGYTTFLLFTIDKPMFKPTRAETGGYDNYDNDDA